MKKRINQTNDFKQMLVGFVITFLFRKTQGDKIS